VVARLGVAWHGASVGQGGCGVSGRRSHGAGRAGRERGAAQGGSRGEGGGGADEPCGAGEGGRAGALPRSGRREEKGGRRGEKKRKKRRKRKEKRKKMRKGKEKKRRGEKREKGERERFAVIPPVATATPVGHARLSRPRAAARRDARVEGKTGFWIQVSGLWGNRKIWRNREVPEKLGLGF